MFMTLILQKLEALDTTNECPLTMEKIRVELDRSIVQKGLSNDELNAWIAVSGLTFFFYINAMPTNNICKFCNYI